MTTRLPTCYLRALCADHPKRAYAQSIHSPGSGTKFVPIHMSGQVEGHVDLALRRSVVPGDREAFRGVTRCHEDIDRVGIVEGGLNSTEVQAEDRIELAPELEALHVPRVDVDQRAFRVPPRGRDDRGS